MQTPTTPTMQTPISKGTTMQTSISNASQTPTPNAIQTPIPYAAIQTPIPYVRDVEGYLLTPDDWNEKVASQLAAEEKLELSDDYWVVLRFMRNYWNEHRVAPDVRHVVQHLADANGYDKKTAKHYLFDLFPYGYVKQACKIAGMRRPRAWSTG